ncbi:MAG: hypothetical protein M3N32_03635 [Actinomycetota bacterium]|nr:hypothetical protein [Actinomycetota bacterium]
MRRLLPSLLLAVSGVRHGELPDQVAISRDAHGVLGVGVEQAVPAATHEAQVVLRRAPLLVGTSTTMR